MAILHRADIRPKKLDLLGEWVPAQPWYAGGEHAELIAVGAFRFDDPLGEVGIETHLIQTHGSSDDGATYQVPLTYRGAPLPGGESLLIGTMQHSVLGRRWVYDGCGDPVYATALAAIILGSATQAEEYVQRDGRLERRTPTASVMGIGRVGNEVTTVWGVEDLQCSSTGTRTVITAPTLELTLLRAVEPAAHAADEAALLGRWVGQNEPVLLATARNP